MSVAALITLLNVLAASGFSIASLVQPELILPVGTTPGGASTFFAMYAAARTLPLAMAVILAVAMGSPAALLVLGSLAGVIQCLDAIVGILQGDLGKTIGPLVIACLQAYAMLRFRKETQPVLKQ
jgi:type IV secretory pathway VirB2 component (pilin)